jgi:hypothetical protein
MWRTERGVANTTPLEIHLHYLCSYHAFNRCDGVGAVVKHAALRSALPGGTGGWPRSPEEYVSMINDGLTSRIKNGKGNHIGFYFGTINRGNELFPPLREVMAGADGNAKNCVGLRLTTATHTPL